MQTRYPLFFVILAAVMLVACLVAPGNLAGPAPAVADAGVCKWNTIDMPGSNDIGQVLIISTDNSFAPSEVEKLVALSDGQSLLAIVNRTPLGAAPLNDPLVLYVGANRGISWRTTAYSHLAAAMANAGDNIANVYDVAAAPDNPGFWAVVTAQGATDAPVNVWVTSDAGASWQDTQLYLATGGTNVDAVGAIDISPDYGGKRDIAVGLRSGTTTAMRLLAIQSGSLPSNWKQQTITDLTTNTISVTDADVVALKFSPNYTGDAALAIVFSMPDDVALTDAGTFYNIALRDLNSGANDIAGWGFPRSIEVKNASYPPGTSPDLTTIVNADLELPSDFSGQSPTLRFAFVSLDAGGLFILNTSGIYGINNTQVNVLMDTTGEGATGKRIHSIAYFGTGPSGKLLAGEVIGSACSATVPIWFADSVSNCSVACWVPSLKPPTGAATTEDCDLATSGNGTANVAWSADGQIAYAGTGCTGAQASDNQTAVWYSELTGVPCQFDESAISISRNNGETWNQLAFIDTYIQKFTDVAASPDCTTIYLASTNNQTNCHGHDSVWRATRSSRVAAPLSAGFPLGYYWERVFCHLLAASCNTTQSDIGLLRLPPPGADCGNGMVIGWAAQAATTGAPDDPKVQAWSPDYGDYWAMLNPRYPVQDFAFESAMLIYDINDKGMLQKIPYTGTAWSSAEPDVDTLIDSVHSIAVQSNGKVLVGGNTSATYPASISVDEGRNFVPLRQALTTGNYHVAFHPRFDSNKTFFIADDSSNGTVYRLTFPTLGITIADADMMAAANGAIGTLAPEPVGIFGLQLAYTGGDNDNALYAAHDTTDDLTDGGVDRTLWPLAGMPKPGIYWDSMKVIPPAGYQKGVTFTREPWSLKICGCCTMDTNSKLWALDARTYQPYQGLKGFLWGFEDCLAKKGPALITADGTLIGCDPVSGRAQEVNLCWEQLCVADGYDLEIAKDKDFSIRVIDWAINGLPGDDNNQYYDYWNARFLKPVDLLKPCVYFPAGGAVIQSQMTGSGAGSGNNSAIALYGNLECGHTYYWRIQVRSCATHELLRSQWSGIRSFIVKAGLPVRADYYGPTALAPDNGCLGCPVKPASFSWTPFKETTKYKFVLAKDAAMTQVVAEAEVPTTAYQYNGTLDYSTNYFWRVMTLTPVPGDWSATFSFQTEPKPAPPAAPAEAPATPLWVWVIIAIGAILLVITLVLIFKSRRW